jgi:hypothetical protein
MSCLNLGPISKIAYCILHIFIVYTYAHYIHAHTHTHTHTHTHIYIYISKSEKHQNLKIFLVSSFSGMLYPFICSILGMMSYDNCHWNYSEMSLSIQGWEKLNWVGEFQADDTRKRDQNWILTGKYNFNSDI